MCPSLTEAKSSHVLRKRGLQPKGPGDAGLTPSISLLSLVTNKCLESNQPAFQAFPGWGSGTPTGLLCLRTETVLNYELIRTVGPCGLSGKRPGS